MVGRPCAGSNSPGWVTGPETGLGVLQVWPPLAEVLINSKDCLPALDTVPTPNT